MIPLSGLCNINPSDPGAPGPVRVLARAAVLPPQEVLPERALRQVVAVPGGRRCLPF